MSNLWDHAKVVYAYTRSQAIQDGALVDVSQTAREAGFKVPVAVTRAVWSSCVAVPEGMRLQDESGRLWDVLWMAHLAIAGSRRRIDRLPYHLHVRNDNRHRTPPLVTLHLHIGPGDSGEPVITIMEPGED